MTEGFVHTLVLPALLVPESSTTPRVPSDQPLVAAGLPCKFRARAHNSCGRGRSRPGRAAVGCACSSSNGSSTGVDRHLGRSGGLFCYDMRAGDSRRCRMEAAHTGPQSAVERGAPY